MLADHASLHETPVPRANWLSRGRTGRIAAAGVATLIPLLVAGCGASTTAKSSTSASSTTKPSALTSITIAYPTPTIHILPLEVGISQGFFAKEGLSVKLVSLGNSQTVMTGLLSGSIKFAGTSAVSILTEASKGAPIESIMQYDSGVPLQLIMSKRYAAAHALSSSSSAAQIVSALKGSTVAEAGLSDKGIVAELLNAYGVASSTVRKVLVSNASAQLTALKTGAVDWYLSSPPIGPEVAASGIGEALLSSANVPEWKADVVNFAVAGNKKYLSSHAALAKRVVTAINESVAFVASNPNGALPTAEKEFPKLSSSILLQSIKDIIWDSSGKQTPSSWQRTVAFDKKTGELAPSVTAAEGVAWTNAYYTGK